jgi:plastocyanin
MSAVALVRSRTAAGAELRSTLVRGLPAVFAGIVIGGLVVGFAAGGTISTILTGQTAGSEDVRIAYGAADPALAEPYSPANLVVTVGDSSVTWYNADNAVHTVTSTTGLFDSQSLGPGESFTFEFTEAGSYAYFCQPHPWMEGSVEVR